MAKNIAPLKVVLEGVTERFPDEVRQWWKKVWRGQGKLHAAIGGQVVIEMLQADATIVSKRLHNEGPPTMFSAWVFPENQRPTFIPGAMFAPTNDALKKSPGRHFPCGALPQDLEPSV